MRRAILAFVLMATAATAQDANQWNSQGQQNGSISGTVQDQETGAPIGGVLITVFINSRFSNGVTYMSPDTRPVRVTSDDQGRYRLNDLPPAMYRVSAQSQGGLGPSGEKTVNLRSGQNVAAINFRFPVFGSISGRVVDQNKEPVPGVTVYSLSKEYGFGGVVRFFYKGVADTDDQGEFTLTGVEPGVPIFLIAAKQPRQLPIHSDAPLNPKLRKPAFVPTYYPNVEQPEGAAAIVLRSGEHHEGVDISMLRAQSYCIEGNVSGGGGGFTGKVLLTGAEYNPSIASGGGAAIFPPTGTLASDGKVRLCGLRRGSYNLIAYYMQGNRDGPSQYALAPVSIVDEDVKDVTIQPVTGIQIPGRVVWEGTPVDPPLSAKLSVNLQRLNRPNFGDRGGSARADIPGDFLLRDVFVDDYRLTASVNAPGVYVKDIFYGPTSIMHTPLRAGTSTDVRVVLAHDGGSVAVRVADKDGNPVPDIHVAIFPAELPSQADLPGALVRGETDQDGNYTHGVLAPGKYLVVATTMDIDLTFDKVRRLWEARSRGSLVELAPNSNAQLTVEPVHVE